MVNDQLCVIDDSKINENSTSNPQTPIKLQVFEMSGSDGFMCDIETGVCGPVSTSTDEEESK